MTLHIENPISKESQMIYRKLTRVNKTPKTQDTKSTHKKQLCFYILTLNT